MRKIRVLTTKAFTPGDIEYMRARLHQNVELVIPADFAPETLTRAVQDDIQALLGEGLSKSLLDAAPDLKLIQIPWTGVDRLDFELLRQYSVPVCNSHSNATVVAEYAVGLMLSITKGTPLHDRSLRTGNWRRPSKAENSDFSPPELLAGKTALLVGYGAIGRKIAQFLSGFSLSLQAVDVHVSQPAPPPLEQLLPPDQLPPALREADIVFVSIPLTDQTRGLFDLDLLSQLKSTAYLINTSRGEVLDEHALYEVLSKRMIAGAAIDTWYKYPSPGQPNPLPSENYPFHELDNLVMSPHRAGFARGRLPHLDDAVENLKRLAAGDELINVLDLNRGY